VQTSLAGSELLESFAILSQVTVTVVKWGRAAFEEERSDSVGVASVGMPPPKDFFELAKQRFNPSKERSRVSAVARDELEDFGVGHETTLPARHVPVAGVVAR
jgi:hypothetical protein